MHCLFISQCPGKLIFASTIRMILLWIFISFLCVETLESISCLEIGISLTVVSLYLTNTKLWNYNQVFFPHWPLEGSEEIWPAISVILSFYVLCPWHRFQIYSVSLCVTLIFFCHILHICLEMAFRSFWKKNTLNHRSANCFCQGPEVLALQAICYMSSVLRSAIGIWKEAQTMQKTSECGCVPMKPAIQT